MNKETRVFVFSLIMIVLSEVALFKKIDKYINGQWSHNWFDYTVIIISLIMIVIWTIKLFDTFR